MENSYVRKRIIFIIAFFIILLLSVILLWNTLKPFFIAILLAYLLDPIVDFLQKIPFLKDKRTLSVAIGFLIGLAFIAIISIIFIPKINLNIQPQDIKGFISKFIDDATKLINKINSKVKIIDVDSFKREIASMSTYIIKNALEVIPSFIMNIVSSIPTILITLLITFYLLKDKDKLFDTLKKYTADSKEEKIKVIFDSINKKIGSYIKSQLIVCFIVAVITIITLILFGLDYSVSLGIFIGLLYVIPYFGPIMGVVPPAIIALTSGFTIPNVMLLLLLLVGEQVLISIIISPKITSIAVSLHPVFVILSILIGAKIWGIIGMIIGVPLAISIKIVIQTIFSEYIGEI